VTHGPVLGKELGEELGVTLGTSLGPALGKQLAKVLGAALALVDLADSVLEAEALAGAEAESLAEAGALVLRENVFGLAFRPFLMPLMGNLASCSKPLFLCSISSDAGFRMVFDALKPQEP
jgi:hypothetical protein